MQNRMYAIYSFSYLESVFQWTHSYIQNIYDDFCLILNLKNGVWIEEMHLQDFHVERKEPFSIFFPF